MGWRRSGTIRHRISAVTPFQAGQILKLSPRRSSSQTLTPLENQTRRPSPLHGGEDAPSLRETGPINPHLARTSQDAHRIPMQQNRSQYKPIDPVWFLQEPPELKPGTLDHAMDIVQQRNRRLAESSRDSATVQQWLWNRGGKQAAIMSFDVDMAAELSKSSHGILNMRASNLGFQKRASTPKKAAAAKKKSVPSLGRAMQMQGDQYVTPSVDNPKGRFDPKKSPSASDLDQVLMKPHFDDAASGAQLNRAARRNPTTLEGAMAEYDRTRLGYETGGRPTGSVAFDVGRREFVNALNQILNTPAKSIIARDLAKGVPLLKAIEKHKAELRAYWQKAADSQVVRDFERGSHREILSLVLGAPPHPDDKSPEAEQRRYVRGVVSTLTGPILNPHDAIEGQAAAGAGVIGKALFPKDPEHAPKSYMHHLGLGTTEDVLLFNLGNRDPKLVRRLAGLDMEAAGGEAGALSSVAAMPTGQKIVNGVRHGRQSRKADMGATSIAPTLTPAGNPNRVKSTELRAGAFKTVGDFVSAAVKDVTLEGRKTMGAVSQTMKSKITDLTGIKFDGSDVHIRIHASEARHIINGHSNSKHGNIPTTAKDFELIPEIINSPDQVILSDKKSFDQHPILIFTKKLGGRMEVVAIVYKPSQRRQGGELKVLSYYHIN